MKILITSLNLKNRGRRLSIISKEPLYEVIMGIQATILCIKEDNSWASFVEREYKIGDNPWTIQNIGPYELGRQLILLS